MTIRCRHNFQYSQGHFQCSKCGKRGREQYYKRNHKKSYALIVISGIIILSGIYVYGTYDVTLKDIIPSEIPIQSSGIEGYIRMGQVTVIDKGTYNQIKINVGVHDPDIEMGEEFGFNAKSGTGLKNENGKTYAPEWTSLRHASCSDYKLDSEGFYKINGKSPMINEIMLCFSVEKKYKTFSLFHSGNQVIGSFSYDSYGNVTYLKQ